MRLLLIAFCISLFHLPVSAQESMKNYSEAFTLIEVWLDAQKDFDRLPGLSAAVIEDQEVLWSGAVGLSNPSTNLPSTDTTLCSICSISKLFTAVAIMKLYDEGKLRLDDRIEDLLPAYKVQQKHPDSGPITVRSLLTHSGGLPREAAYPYWTGPDFPFPTRSEIDSKLEEQETLYPASTYFQYSNLGLTLLGEIVEEISGQSYEEYVEENILKPLGLSDTRPFMPEALYGGKLAIGYSAIKRSGTRDKVNFFQANGIAPAAGFSSNVLDLGKFASWQFRLRDTSATEILKPSTLKNMHLVHWTNPDWKNTWGLGFNVFKGSDGSTWVGHGGSCPGYRSDLKLDLKNKKAYAVMINASGTDPGKYAKGIKGILDKAETIHTDSTQGEINLEAYAGYYSTEPWWGEVYVSSWNGKLVLLDLPTDEPAEAMHIYKHLEGDSFERIKEDGTPGFVITFVRDNDGVFTHFTMNDNHRYKIMR